MKKELPSVLGWLVIHLWQLWLFYMHVLPQFDLLEGTKSFLDILVELHEHILLLLSTLSHYGVVMVALNPWGGFWLTKLTNFRRLLRLVENEIAALRVRVMHGHSLLLTNWIVSLSRLIRVGARLDSDLTIVTADSQDRRWRWRFALPGCASTNSSLIDMRVIWVKLSSLLLADRLAFLLKFLDMENLIDVLDDSMAVLEELIQLYLFCRFAICRNLACSPPAFLIIRVLLTLLEGDTREARGGRRFLKDMLFTMVLFFLNDHWFYYIVIDFFDYEGPWRSHSM